MMFFITNGETTVTTVTVGGSSTIVFGHLLRAEGAGLSAQVRIRLMSPSRDLAQAMNDIALANASLGILLVGHSASSRIMLQNTSKFEEVSAMGTSLVSFNPEGPIAPPPPDQVWVVFNPNAPVFRLTIEQLALAQA